MRDAELDPYRNDPSGSSPDDFTVLVNFFEDVELFIEGIFVNPPDALRGEWLNEQREAWEELRHSPTEAVRTRVEALRLARSTHLPNHGLTGQSLRAKMLSWRDNARAFLARRGIGRLAKALRTGAVVMDSVAEVLGFGGAHKEIIKGLHHLTELAIEEGS